MAAVEVERTHALPLDEAIRRAKGLMENLQEKRPELVKEVEWNADGTQGIARGQGFEGRLQVTDSTVAIEIDLNLMLRPFKKKILATLERKFDETFE